LRSSLFFMTSPASAMAWVLLSSSCSEIAV
jgi:hypothetical protein